MESRGGHRQGCLRNTHTQLWDLHQVGKARAAPGHPPEHSLVPIVWPQNHPRPQGSAQVPPSLSEPPGQLTHLATSVRTFGVSYPRRVAEADPRCRAPSRGCGPWNQVREGGGWSTRDPGCASQVAWPVDSVQSPSRASSPSCPVGTAQWLTESIPTEAAGASHVGFRAKMTLR